ncbi:MAG TPA: hypothetical protein VIR63_00795 [Pontiella sp.]
MNLRSAIYTLITTSTLISATYSDTVFFDDFSSDLNNKAHIAIPKEHAYNLYKIDRGQWICDRPWSAHKASVASTEPKFIPPMDSEGGAAVNLRAGHCTVLLDKNWDENKTYTLTVRTRLTDRNGEETTITNPTALDLSLACWTPDNNISWLRGHHESRISSSEWTTSKLTLEPGDQLSSAHGMPIVLRLNKKGGADDQLLWIDIVKLESEDPSLRNSQENTDVKTATISLDRKAAYIAEQARKEFNLTEQQKEKVLSDVKMYLQCCEEIKKMAIDGDITKANKYRPIVENAFNKAMIETVGLDSVDKLKDFNETTLGILK